MNDKVFQRIELWILDLVIEILSKSGATRSFLGQVIHLASSKPLFLTGMLICASCFFGMLSGFAFYLMTFPVR